MKMDKCAMKRRLLQLIRESVPFKNSAKVTCLMNIKIDACNDVLHFEVLEEEVDKSGGSGCGSSNGNSGSNNNSQNSSNNNSQNSSNINSQNSSNINRNGTKSKRKSFAPQKLRVAPPPSETVEQAPSDKHDQAQNLAQTSSSSQSETKVEGECDDLQKSQRVPISTRTGLQNQQQQQQQATPSSHVLSIPTVLGANVASLQTKISETSDIPPGNFNHYIYGKVSNGKTARAMGVQKQQKLVSKPTVNSTQAAGPAVAAEAVKAAVASGKKLPIAPSSSATSARRARPLSLRSRRGTSKTFPCNQCNEIFTSLSQLSQHTYSMHKCYKCTFCGAKFTQRSNLQRHSLKHVGFKPFACRCCHKSYYRKDHLVRHIEVTHPGYDPKLTIDTRLSSAECLEFLERKQDNSDASVDVGEAANHHSMDTDSSQVAKEELMEHADADDEQQVTQLGGADHEAEVEEEEEEEEGQMRIEEDADMEGAGEQSCASVAEAATATATVSVQVQAESL